MTRSTSLAVAPTDWAVLLGRLLPLLLALVLPLSLGACGGGDSPPAGTPTPPLQATSGPGGASYAHATVRETTLEDGSPCYHFISRPGRKG